MSVSKKLTNVSGEQFQVGAVTKDLTEEQLQQAIYDTGVRHAEERIIKLLEENYLKFYSDDGLNKMVALIKGANK